jgi:hypothetical protein
MIRRHDGSDWPIIEQIKHANLGAEIARAWSIRFVAPFTPLCFELWQRT